MKKSELLEIVFHASFLFLLLHFLKGLNISVPFGVVSTKKEFLGIFRIKKEKLETHGKKKKKNSTSVTLRALHQRAAGVWTPGPPPSGARSSPHVFACDVLWLLLLFSFLVAAPPATDWLRESEGKKKSWLCITLFIYIFFVWGHASNFEEEGFIDRRMGERVGERVRVISCN